MARLPAIAEAPFEDVNPRSQKFADGERQIREMIRIGCAAPRSRSGSFRGSVALRRQTSGTGDLRPRTAPRRSPGDGPFRSRRRGLRALHRAESTIRGFSNAADAARGYLWRAAA